MLKISVQELKNYLILPISLGGFFGEINEYGKLCIGDMYLSKYMQKYIKPILDICKSLSDADLIYNLSSLANPDNLHLFIYG